MKVTGTGPSSTDRTRDIGGSGAANSVGNSKDKRSRTSIAPEIDSGVSDKVAISGRAKDALKAKEIARSAPDVDDAKVARLKAAIQNGTYNVDAEKIADRLVDEHMMSSF